MKFSLLVVMTAVMLSPNVQANPGYGGHFAQSIFGSSVQLLRLAQQFEWAVDSRYRRSPVNRRADDFAEEIEDFLDEVQQGDIRDMIDEWQDVQRDFARLDQAFRGCPVVPVDRQLAHMYRNLARSYYNVNAQMARLGGFGGVQPIRPVPPVQPIRPVPPVRPIGPRPPVYRPYPGHPGRGVNIDLGRGRFQLHIGN